MTKNQERALAALMIYRTKEEAALAAGITARTLRQYFHDEEFMAEYRQAFGNMIEESTRQAQRALSPALKAVREICEDQKAPVMARIAAARTLLEYTLKLTELADIEQRLEALENANRK